MARYEIKRYVYMCDELLNSNVKCSGSEVIEAVCENDADLVAQKHGWEAQAEWSGGRSRRTGAWTCGRKDHWTGDQKKGGRREAAAV